MSDTPDDDMPERVDPIDTAYARAEALLDDEAARAARRARLLAAVTSEPAPVASSVIRPARRDSGWGRGGWLAAACVAGLSVFVVFQIYRPVPHQPAATPAAAVSASKPTTTTPPVSPPATAAPKQPEAKPAPPRIVARPPAAALPSPAMPAPPPPSASAPVTVDKPRASAQAAESRGYLAAPPPPPPAPPPSNSEAETTTTTVTDEIVTSKRAQPAPPPTGSADASSQSNVADVVVTAERREQRTQKVPIAVSAFTASKRDVTGANRVSSAKALPDRGAALRAAAAAGQVSEVEAQLREGAPVDAPDANGDTALILSIRADQPDVAAVLRQHGASLDHRNHAGQSARDLAKASGDEALGRALGLAP